MTMSNAIPLSFDEMKEFIVDPSKTLVVDYSNSKLRNKTFLVYCTNISLQNIDIDFSGCDREAIFSLIDAYITQKSTLKLDVLLQCVIRLVIFAKGIQYPDEYQPFFVRGTQILSGEDLQLYWDNETRRENLVKLMHVLDSIPIYLLTTNTSFRDVYGEPSEVFNVVDDINYTGYTFVNLLEHPIFLLVYYTAPVVSNSRYFKQQYEETLYKGKSLYYYFVNTEANFLLPLFNAIFSGELTPEFLDEMRNALLKEQEEQQ